MHKCTLIAADLRLFSQVAGFWDGFVDPESGITGYSVSVTGDQGRLLQAKTAVGDVNAFSNHHFHLLHGEVVRSHIIATDGALRESVTVNTSSFIVDLTPPALKRLTIGSTTSANAVFQTSSSPLQVGLCAVGGSLMCFGHHCSLQLALTIALSDCTQ